MRDSNGNSFGLGGGQPPVCIRDPENPEWESCQLLFGWQGFQRLGNAL